MVKSIFFNFKKLEDVLEEWYNIALFIVQLYSNKDRICIKNTHKW